MSVQTALFTKVLHNRSLTESFELAAELGYDGIEPMGREPHLSSERSIDEVTAFRELLDDLGLGVPCIASYTGGYVGRSDAEREAELEELETFLRFAEALDCDLVRHNSGGPPVRDATDEMFETAAEWLRRAADIAADYDAMLGVEIHHFRLTETVDSTLELLELIDRDNVGAIYDPGNLYIVDADCGQDSIERLGEKLFHVHVKDELRVDDPDLPRVFELTTDNGDELFQRKLLGDGDVNYGQLFETLVDEGYEGYVTDECYFPQADLGRDVAIARHELSELKRLISASRGGDD